MGWIRVSDDFYDNDKLVDVGPLGAAMHFAAMGFCNRNLTDGYFKKGKAKLFLDFDGISITTASGSHFAVDVEGEDAVKMVIEWMVEADLWHEKGHGCDECHSRDDGGEPGPREYLIHDYLKFQPSRSEVEAKAEANRKRVESFRAARKAEKEAAEAQNAVRNGVGNALRTANVHDTPSPTPSPSTSSYGDLGGGVTKVDARVSETPRPHCSKHKENYEGPCRACKRRREWDEAHADALKANELEAKRREKEAAKSLRENCTRCGGNNTYEDDRGVHPCDHKESRHA